MPTKFTSPRDPSRWAAYRTTVFDLPANAPRWLGAGPVALVTAFNPGTILELHENQRRDDALHAEVVARGLKHLRVIGRAPDASHAEPSWAIACARSEAVALGGAFGQDAIFLVEHDALTLAPCDGSPSELVGTFSTRCASAPLAACACGLSREEA